MTQPKRSRPRANPGAKPDPAPADPGAPIDVRRPKDGGFFYVWNEVMDYMARSFTVTVETKERRIVDGRKRYVKTGRTKTEEHTLGAVGLAVYCVLCFHGDNHAPGRNSYPSLGKIAKRLGLSFNTVKTKVMGLEKLGLVEIIREVGQVHEYRIVPLPRKAREPSQPFTRLAGPNGKEPSQPFTRSTPEPSQPSTTPPSQPLTTNNTHTNKNTTKTPKPAENKAPGGGGADAGNPEPEHAETVMRELVTHGAARTQHAQRIAAKIAQHAPDLDVARAVIGATAQDVKASKAKNPPGAMLTRLDAMTPDDWKAKTTKPANDAPALIVRRRQQVTP